MLRKLLPLLLVFALLFIPSASLAQDADTPTIAVLRWDKVGPFAQSDRGMLDMLRAYDLITDEERASLQDGEDLYGEKPNIFWRNAGSDIPTTNLMMEEALDRGADVVLASGTSVAQVAAVATADLEAPPALLFTVVSAPYSAGVAESSCVKPAHVSGATPVHDYVALVDAVIAQDPDISLIGTYITPGMSQSERSESEIRQAAEAHGIAVVAAPVLAFPDIPLATQTLLDDGVGAIIVSLNFVLGGIPSIVIEATDYHVPVVSPIPGLITDGAPIGVGFNDHFWQGVIAARMLIGYLHEGLDLASVSIAEVPGTTVAVNYDSAADMGIEISDELSELATFKIRDGKFSFGAPPAKLAEMTLDERKAQDAAFLESLHCSDEMIAEQQAQLNAG